MKHEELIQAAEAHQEAVIGAFRNQAARSTQVSEPSICSCSRFMVSCIAVRFSVIMYMCGGVPRWSHGRFMLTIARGKGLR